MKKLLRIAQREFVSTVFTRSFIFGLLFLPVLATVVFAAAGIASMTEFHATGRIALIDPTGQVAAAARQILRNRTPATGSDLTLVQLPLDAVLEEEKPLLLNGREVPGLRAIVVVAADAIRGEDDATGLGSYDLYLGRDIDPQAVAIIRSVIDRAIIDRRFEAYGLERELVDRLTQLAPGQTVTVTATEEHAGFAGLNAIVPIAFMALLFLGIMGGGQHLMTSMIEEKSTRVVEVLLAAVSPLQLMAGKLLGHVGISLLAMSVYLVAGVLALTSFSLIGLLDPAMIAYLLLFFLIAFFTVGSLMLAIGSAVNELREAQSLMMPVTLVLMLPVFLWMPISRDPNSTLSLVASFVPPVNTFGMLLRMASTEPPPGWQVWLSILIGCAGVYAAIWCAARVFRIGLLVSGKPPGLRTLVRWIRAG